MATATEAQIPRDGTAKSPSSQASPAPTVPSQALDASNRIIVIQSNFIAEGGTINILSSHCDGSTVTKLAHVTGTAETSLQPPMPRQLTPAEYARESVIMNGNTFGPHVMINIGSSNCTGSVKQTALPSHK